jgi:hypothetical protein
MVDAKFGDEVAAFAHFGVDGAKDHPINCMEGALVPFETVLVVSD